jgi:hypothetical protein
MPLSQRQKDTAKKQAALAKNGDIKATRFFQNMEKDSPALHKEFQEFLQNGEGAATGIKRSDLETDTSALSQKQFKVAVLQAVAAKGGDDGAAKFFTEQERIAESGSKVAATFIAVRDEIVAAGDDKIHKVRSAVSGKIPAPAVEGVVIQGQKAPVEHKSGKVT